MTRIERGHWLDALWDAMSQLHSQGPNRWRDWNDVEEFFLDWIRSLEYV